MKMITGVLAFGIACAVGAWLISSLDAPMIAGLEWEIASLNAEIQNLTMFGAQLYREKELSSDEATKLSLQQEMDEISKRIGDLQKTVAGKDEEKNELAYRIDIRNLYATYLRSAGLVVILCGCLFLWHRANDRKELYLIAMVIALATFLR